MTFYSNAYDKFFAMLAAFAGAVIATRVIVGSVFDAGMIG